MMLAAVIKIPWLNYRGGGNIGLYPPCWVDTGKQLEKLIIVANLGWQERQSLSPLE